MVCVISGRVVPERADVNLTGLPRVDLHHIDGRSMLLDICVLKSQLSVRVDVAKGWFSYDEIRDYVESIVRINLDGIGFFNGCGYDLEIISIKNLDAGDFIVFGVDYPPLNEQKFARTLPIRDLVMLAHEDHQLRRGLADLREGLRSSEDSAFFSFRAIESVKQGFRQSAKEEDKVLWARMREHLNIDKRWINEVSRLAAGARHGRHDPVDPECRQMALRRAWLVIDRYSIWLSNGRRKVDPKLHPMYFATDI